MIRLVLRRLLVAVPTLLVVSAFAFSLLYLTPGDPAFAIAGEGASPEQVQQVRERLGLDQVAPVRFLSWVSGAATGDLGDSLYSVLPVAELIGQRLPVTLALMATAIIISVVVGVPLGLAAGLRPGTWIDRLASSAAVVGLATPAFLFGLVLLSVLSVELKLLPVGGYEPFAEDPLGWAKHIILPGFTLAIPTLGEIARQMRAGVADAGTKDYVRSAEARGLSPMTVAIKHIARNASIPVVTVLGLQVSRLLGTAVIVEAVFAMSGVGTLLITSVFQRDMPVVQGIVLLMTVIVVAANLLVDMSYGWLDPRTRTATA